MLNSKNKLKADRKESVVLIGAGPTSLAAGLELVKHGYRVTILEREDRVGGISKTIQKNGYRFDVGGHRFFTKNEEVDRLWRGVLGSDFKKTPRLSRIYYNKKFFMYPIELGDTFKKAGLVTSILCGGSFVRYKIFPIKPEKSFADWTTNRFGKKLFEMFFKSYTEKVWGISTRELSAEWAAQRIKGLSLWEVLRNDLFKSRNQVKSLINEFLYPKYGPGMMYETMAKDIEKLGGEIDLNRNVVKIKLTGSKVTGVVAEDGRGKKYFYKADHFISTMPLPDTIDFLSPKLEVAKSVKRELKFRDFLSVNLIVDKSNIFPDNWIYVHDPSVTMGRIQNFKNWSKYMTKDLNHSPIGCEYFCNQGDEIWSMNDKDLIEMATKEMEKIGLIVAKDVISGNVYRMRDAYPVYMGNYQKAILEAREELEKIDNLQVAGRGGTFRYNNMDHSILAGLYAARNIMGGNFNVWEVNTEEEYHEERRSFN